MDILETVNIYGDSTLNKLQIEVQAEAKITPPPHGSEGERVGKVVFIEGLQQHQATGDQQSTNIAGAGTTDHAGPEQMSKIRLDQHETTNTFK